MILEQLQIRGPIRLMTNNPEKRDALLEAGVELHSVVHMPIREDQLSPIAKRELIEKRSALGHWAMGLDLECV
jgi:GTP cyclohydrolase II